MNKKYITGVVILTLAVVGVTWWVDGKSGMTSYRGPIEKVTLQLKWLHQAQFAGFYAAAQKGFYRDEGLDVSIKPVGEDLSSFHVIERVAKGEIEFGVSGADQVILARSEALPVKAIAVIFQQSPVGLAALQKSKITTLDKAVGKSTGVWSGQDTQIVFRAMLSNANIMRGKIKEVEIPSGVDYLLSGKVDTQMVYLINEGLLAKEEGYKLDIIYPEDYGVRFYGDTLVANDALIAQRPDLVARFVRATLKGWNWAIANPDEAAALSLVYDPHLSASHEKNMMRASLPFIYTSKVDIGGMDEAIWKEMESILFKKMA